MNATHNQAVAAPLTANFRETKYGYIACTEADAAIARTFLPGNIARNSHICFGHEMLESFKALAKAADVRIQIVTMRQLKAVA